MAITDSNCNSFMIPAEQSSAPQFIEEFASRSRNNLWLTVREGRRLVLKGLPDHLRANIAELTRLRKEYSLGLRINHPSVAATYGFEDHPQVGPIIVMEYVDGLPLDTFLKQYQPTRKERISIAVKLADALRHIHSLGLSHRDLKPDNILVSTHTHEPKIIDCGLGDSDDSVVCKQSQGTERYGAPEQQAPAAADSRADVYAFGKILQTLLPGRSFAAIRRSCLQTDPSRRPSMAELHAILGRRRARQASPAFWFVSIGVIAAVAVAAAAIIYAPYGQKNHTPPSSEIDGRIDHAEAQQPEPAGEEHTIDSHTEHQVASPSPFPSQPSASQPSGSAELPKPSLIDPGDSPYSHIFSRYMDKAHEVIARYGSIPFDDQSSRAIDQRDKRWFEVNGIVEQLKTDLVSEGAHKDEVMRLSTAMWQQAARAINENDGLNQHLRNSGITVY